MTFTGLIGRICHVPAARDHRRVRRARIHPNILTFVGVLINVAAGRARWPAAASSPPASS